MTLRYFGIVEFFVCACMSVFDCGRIISSPTGIKRYFLCLKELDELACGRMISSPTGIKCCFLCLKELDELAFLVYYNLGCPKRF